MIHVKWIATIGILLFVFIVFSNSSAIQISYSAEEYAWTNGSPMKVPRFEVSAEALNGKIYVIGGGHANGTLMDTVEAYDP